MQTQSPQYVTRSWVRKEHRFVLGSAGADNCAACNNTCPCNSAAVNQPNGAYNAPLSHVLLRYEPDGAAQVVEVPVSS